MIDSLPDPPYPPEIRARGWRFEFDTERIRTSDTWAIADPMIRPWLLMLWMTAWEQRPVGLPGDERAVAGLLGMPLALFQQHRDVLLRGWKMCSDGRLYHRVMTERVQEMVDRRAKDAVRVARHRDKQKQQVTEDVTRDTRVTPPLVRHPPPTTHIKPKTTGRSAPEAPPGFTAFWTAYPNLGRRKNKATCLTLWRAKNLEPLADAIVAHVEAMKLTPSWRPNVDGDHYEPEPLRYLRNRNWEDGLPEGTVRRLRGVVA